MNKELISAYKFASDATWNRNDALALLQTINAQNFAVSPINPSFKATTRDWFLIAELAGIDMNWPGYRHDEKEEAHG